MSWIRELKVGDQFLDSTGKHVATVTHVEEGRLRWKWDCNNHASSFWRYKHLEEIIIHSEWKLLTPLLKELL